MVQDLSSVCLHQTEENASSNTKFRVRTPERYILSVVEAEGGGSFIKVLKSK